MKNGATQGTPTPPTKVAKTNAYAFLIYRVATKDQELSMDTQGTCAGFLLFSTLYLQTYVIAQALIFSSELCYTVSGLC